MTILPEALLRERMGAGAPCSADFLVPRRTSVMQIATFSVNILQGALCHLSKLKKKKIKTKVATAEQLAITFIKNN